jgi:ABC-type nitrate/sulfonate/bicarbonate transport system permease component
MRSQISPGLESGSRRSTPVGWTSTAATRRLSQWAVSIGWWALSLGIVVAMWELAVALRLVNPVILPPPHQFIAEIRNQAQFLMPQVGATAVGGNFAALTATWASLQRVLSGLALAFVSAVTLGSLAFYFEIFGKLTLPTITLLAPIASVAWIPLAIFAFGVGDRAAIFVVFISVVFTLTLGTVNNMHNVDQVYINTARVLGASRRQVIQHVIFPAVLPQLFVIMRINLFGAWMGVLAAEMVGVRSGLGAIVVVGRQMMNMNLTFLGMAMIGLVGYLLDASFGLVQRRVLWWKSTAQL